MQTAVKGPTADSQDAVFLPMEHDAAQEFRREHSGMDSWCGTVNGCGRQLFTRISGEKIPHFFHRGESEAQCRRAQKNRAGSTGRIAVQRPGATTAPYVIIRRRPAFTASPVETPLPCAGRRGSLS